MTRDEEMWKAVEEEHGTLTPREAFVSLTAMEWADKTMLEKACSYLYAKTKMSGSEINSFKKAMEE